MGHFLCCVRSYPLQTAIIYSVDHYGREFILNFQDDFFRITGNSKIFTKQDLSYLWLNSTSIADNSGNYLEGIDKDWALMMGPTAIRWSLDINVGKISIVFSDTIAAGFSLNGFVTIQNSYNYSEGSTYLALTTDSPSEISPFDSTNRTVVVPLSQSDLNSFKLNYDLLHSAPNLFLTVNFNLTYTLNGGGVVPFLPTVEVANRSALLITEYTPDGTPPRCLSFGLDLSSGYGNDNFKLLTNFIFSQFIVAYV